MTISTETLAGKKPAHAAVSAKTWTVEAVAELYELPFNDLLYRAQGIHRQQFPAGEIELATLLSIKTGGCPEDCAYCPQAARYTPASRQANCCRSPKSSPPPKRRSKTAQRVFAWAPRGANRKRAISRKSRRWSARSRRSDLRPAPRWEC